MAKKLFLSLSLLAGLMAAGCTSGESAEQKALDTAAPTANVTPPPATSAPRRAASPPSVGGPGAPAPK